MVGNKYGRLLVVAEAGNRIAGGQTCRFVTCQCECGTEVTAKAHDIRRGNTNSCGCFREQRRIESHTTHGCRKGRTSTREYSSWQSIQRRCYNPKNPKYPRYGARGIKVCDRWLASFGNFLADMGHRPIGTSIDRIDNDGPYSPENCRWATPKEQANNTRRNRIIEWEGAKYTVIQLCEKLGMDQTVVRARLRLNWTELRAFTEPVRKMKLKSK